MATSIAVSCVGLNGASFVDRSERFGLAIVDELRLSRIARAEKVPVVAD